MGFVCVAYLIIGLAMPVLPLYVHQELGLGAFTVGLVASAPFAMALLVRMWAGHFADSRGPKGAVVTGLSIAAAAGALYLLSMAFTNRAELSVGVLIVGRLLLGAAESFLIAGALSWGLGLMGAQNTGKVMSWVGTALYAAFAVGAPGGAALYGRYGFASVGLATLLIPAVALVLVALLRPVAHAAPKARPPFVKIMSAVWMPGIGVALSGVGFAAITTFIVLLFAARGWNFAWLALTLVSVAFIVGRMAFGHLPDRVGGAKIALICIVVEAFGQLTIWLAPTSSLAFVGVVLSGLGYSLVYPGFGVDLDLSLGVLGPALGLVAGGAGIGTVYLVTTIIVLLSGAVAFQFIRSDAAMKRQRKSVPALAAPRTTLT